MQTHEDWQRPRYLEVRMNWMTVIEIQEKKKGQEKEKNSQPPDIRIYPFTYEQFNDELRKITSK